MIVFYKIFIFFLLLVVFPVGVVITALIVLFSGFPAFYQQKRIGKNGKVFCLYKFRSMVLDAERQRTKLFNLNEVKGPVFKIYHDPRYTRIGKFLSHTGLDELPQLINVLKGEMALFGPRPLPVYEYQKLKTWQKQRQRILPGIISPAILDGKYHQDFQKWMKSDLNYVKNKNFVLDLKLFRRTLVLLVRLLSKELGSILSF